MLTLIGDPFCKCSTIPDKDFANISWALKQWYEQKKMCKQNCHAKREQYQYQNINVFRDELNRLYTDKEIGVKAVKGHGKIKIHPNRIFVSGFFECKKGLYVMTVAVGQSNVANHCIVFDSWRKLIIDPNYAEPIFFEVLYTDGKPDEQKWKSMFKKLNYQFFHKMQQVYSKNSRFCVH
jgi:hypothetical protein